MALPWPIRVFFKELRFHRFLHPGLLFRAKLYQSQTSEVRKLSNFFSKAPISIIHTFETLNIHSVNHYSTRLHFKKPFNSPLCVSEAVYQCYSLSFCNNRHKETSQWMHTVQTHTNQENFWFQSFSDLPIGTTNSTTVEESSWQCWQLKPSSFRMYPECGASETRLMQLKTLWRALICWLTGRKQSWCPDWWSAEEVLHLPTATGWPARPGSQGGPEPSGPSLWDRRTVEQSLD